MSHSGHTPEVQREGALLSWVRQFAPYGIITLDKQLRVQSWNHWMESHSGRLFEDVAQKNLFTLFPELDERKLVGPFARALIGESSVLSTALHHYLLALPPASRNAGVPHMLQTARIAPLLAGREVCGVIVMIEDVTQRETQAEALIRQHRRDEVLSWALAHFLISSEPWKSMRQLFFKIAEHLDFDTFLLYVRDVETDVLSLYTFGGVPASLEAEFQRHPLFTGLGDARETTVFNSIQTRTEPEFAPLKNAGISAAVASPLFFNDRSLGILCFATWSRDTIAPAEADLLGTISQYLAAAVDRENTNQLLAKAKAQLAAHAQLLEKQVAERTLRLQETISELETLSYSLAHDLKAPVRGMIGYCEVLLEDYGALLPPDATEILHKLARAPKRMEVLIRDLLRFSEISREAVALAPVNIEPLVEDILAMRAPAVREAATIQSPLHPVLAHRALLEQVLSNLLDNAMKFVPAGTLPKISIFTEAISQNSPGAPVRTLLFNSVEAPRSGNTKETERATTGHVRLWVVDQGIGIAPQMHQKIFGIFERGVTADLYEGTGIGLAIVARAVERMGGRYGVESEPGKGSRFWIELQSA